MKRSLAATAACCCLFLLTVLSAQTAIPKRLVGTVVSLRPDTARPDTAEVELRSDQGTSILARLTSDSLVQRVAPGEKNLQRAETLKISAIAAGDRVLVVLLDGSRDIRRIVVMPAAEISNRDEAGRLDWTRRGVSGVVIARIGNEITLRTRSIAGAVQTTVALTPQTTFRRYAPDSVRFADAVASSSADIALGDQLRARGARGSDGLKITAEDVVFGTFLTKAGPITSVSAESREITITDNSTNRPLVIKLAPDSQMKKMLDAGFMPGNGGPPGTGGPAGDPSHGAPDLAQLLDHMPPVTLEELQPGQTIVVSSTRGSSSGQVTAIMLVANADALLRLARSGGRDGPQQQNVRTPNAGGMSPGMGSFELPGLIP